VELRVFWSALLRRWYLLLVVIACAGYGAYSVFTHVGPTYKAEGASLIFPPMATVQRAAATTTLGNPYLELNGVSQARDIVIRSLTAKSTQERLAAEYPNATFEATPDFTNSAPIIQITVESPQAAESVAAMRAMLALVPPTLVQLQEGLGLSDGEKITARQLLADQEATPVHKSQIRAGVLAGAGILCIGLLMIGLVDGMLTHRRRIRARRAHASPKSGFQILPDATAGPSPVGSAAAGAPAADTAKVKSTTGQRRKPRRGRRSADTAVSASDAFEDELGELGAEFDAMMTAED
jgi:hypothetical protein